jgi:hypothetical protein
MSVENNLAATNFGGVTGKGFTPGRSGNPGGRPKGLAKRVRELVGSDGERIATFFFDVMTDPTERTADRMEAARWLGDRGFGKVTTPAELPRVGDSVPVETHRKRTPERFAELLKIAHDLGWDGRAGPPSDLLAG